MKTRTKTLIGLILLGVTIGAFTLHDAAPDVEIDCCIDTICEDCKGDMTAPRSGFANADEYITEDNHVIEDIAHQFAELNMTEADTANVVLDWVQHSIDYEWDTDVYGKEYYQYPVETLCCGTGDCEDVSFLYASIMEALGYDVALIRADGYPMGHMTVGVDVEGLDGCCEIIHGNEYYIADPTTESDIGDVNKWGEVIMLQTAFQITAIAVVEILLILTWAILITIRERM